jgi:hypothetical protein
MLQALQSLKQTLRFSELKVRMLGNVGAIDFFLAEAGQAVMQLESGACGSLLSQGELPRRYAGSPIFGEGWTKSGAVADAMSSAIYDLCCRRLIGVSEVLSLFR